MAPKKIVQDIVPSKRRSIRDVTLNDEPMRKSTPKAAMSRADRGIRVPVHLEHTALEKQAAPVRPRPSVPKETKESPSALRKVKKNAASRNWKWIVGGFALVSCLLVAYVASHFLARASVKIALRSENVPISGAFSATENAESPNLSFETISTTTVAHVSAPASAGAIVNAYATGMALLINSGSASSQKPFPIRI